MIAYISVNTQVVGYANRHLVQIQLLTDRKLFGTHTLINDFIKKLTKTETIDGGWASIYVDQTTGKQWLKYISDDRNFQENLMLISPEPTTDELIEIAFNSKYPDEIFAAATRLNLEERTYNKEYRQKLIDKLKEVDTLNLNSGEKERIKIIIGASQLTDRVNKRDVVGKHFSEIQNDADFYNKVADLAENILNLV